MNFQEFLNKSHSDQDLIGADTDGNVYYVENLNAMQFKDGQFVRVENLDIEEKDWQFLNPFYSISLQNIQVMIDTIFGYCEEEERYHRKKDINNENECMHCDYEFNENYIPTMKIIELCLLETF